MITSCTSPPPPYQHATPDSPIDCLLVDDGNNYSAVLVVIACHIYGTPINGSHGDVGVASKHSTVSRGRQ